MSNKNKLVTVIILPFPFLIYMIYFYISSTNTTKNLIQNSIQNATKMNFIDVYVRGNNASFVNLQKNSTFQNATKMNFIDVYIRDNNASFVELEKNSTCYNIPNFNGHKLCVHHISKLFYKIDDYFLTYPSWSTYDGDISIAMSIRLILSSKDEWRKKNKKTAEIKQNIFDECFILNRQKQIFGKATEGVGSYGWICLFEHDVIDVNQLSGQIQFGIDMRLKNNTKQLFLFELDSLRYDLPKLNNALRAEKHDITVSVHDGIWGYPPLNFINYFISYYLFNGVTQFYLYHTRCDLLQFSMNNSWNKWKYPELNTLNKDIEIYLYDVSTIYIDEPRILEWYRDWYWRKKIIQFWIIRHAFHATKINSKWNIAIDLDEYIVIKNNETLLQFAAELENKNIIGASINRFKFDYQMCWLYDRLNKSIQKYVNDSDINYIDVMIFRERETVNGNKIMYQTNKMELLGIHNGKPIKTIHTQTAYFAHVKALWFEDKCSILLGESNLNDEKYANMSSKYCIDNSNMNLPIKPLNIHVHSKWKCPNR